MREPFSGNYPGNYPGDKAEEVAVERENKTNSTYPAHEVSFVFAEADSHDEVVFPVNGRRVRLRLFDLARAAKEVGSALGDYVSPANYAMGVGPLLEELEKLGWVIQPSARSNPSSHIKVMLR